MYVRNNFTRLVLDSEFEGVFFDENMGLVKLSSKNKFMRKAWSSSIKGDQFLIIKDNNGFVDLYAVEIINRSLSTDFKTPLKLFVRVLGATSYMDLPIEIDSAFEKLEISKFKKYWLDCISHKYIGIDNSSLFSKPIHIYAVDGYKIFVAYSKQDVSFVKILAKLHPFGYKKTFITFICEYEGQLEGAICVNYSTQNSDKIINKRKKFFKNDLSFYKNNSLFISRIHSKPNRFKVHEHLLLCLEKFSVGLVNQPDYSTIEGVSYDYHPKAHKLGYNIILPKFNGDSFYYFKHLFNRKQKSVPFNHENIKRIIRDRSKINYWIVYGPREYVEKSLELKEWGLSAIQEYDYNRGIWHILKKGDIVFICDSENRELLGSLVVAFKRLKQPHETYNQFPLWIEFSDSYEADNPFAISQKYFSKEVGITQLEDNKGQRWFQRIKNKL